VNTVDLIDPSTAEVFDRLPVTSAEEADEMVRRAAGAQAVWAALGPARRADSLRSLAQAVTDDADTLTAVETRNAGVLSRVAEWGVQHVRDSLMYFAGGVERMTGQQIPVEAGLDVTVHEPLGVVGLIAPWNFPVVVAGRGMAPAVAAGNAVILKPSELTPLTALRLAELAEEAGLPEGLVQVIVGEGRTAGRYLVEHPGVRGIAFTGSTLVGRQIMEMSSRNLKRLSLELGGKSANIVFEDADLESAALQVPGAVFDLAGQDCCARSRLLIQRGAVDAFMDYLEPVINGLVVGDPRDAATDIGPLISERQRERVQSFLDEDVDIAFQGSAPQGAGFWFPPTVLSPSDRPSRASREEVFGPILSIVPFDDEADALRLANSTEYGLAGSIWTENLGCAMRVARGLDAGNISVNSHSSVRYSTPFGGFKQSGLGRALGPESLYRFTETKNIFFSTGR
jgi:acyl-CoA reductase-like NAD-dependent aldehyde dehydrogenase